jgi:F-type H+-transporting ATPase subunit gamma
MVDKKKIWAYVTYLKKFKEISKAVQMIAIAKLRKLNTRIESREFALSFAVALFDDVDNDTECRRVTVVVLTSERSCCGRLNSEVLSAARDTIDLYLRDYKLVRIISIGWRGRANSVYKYKAELCKSVTRVGQVSFPSAYVVSLCVLDTTFDKCLVVFSKYYKIFEQVAAVYEFSPYTLFTNAIYTNRGNNFFYDSLVAYSTKQLRKLYNYHVCLVILDAFDENTYSESGCRAYPMEMAHKNANGLIKEQMLVYNKARQEGITTELLEVVSGAIHTV